MMERSPPATLGISRDTIDFLDELKQNGFSGEVSSDIADRIACSTDNSIYELMPQAVVYPRLGKDLSLLMQLAHRPAHQHLKIYPRGGGTSTNGQSLGAGVVVDTSRFMRRILDFDADTGLVRAEPGLVRDKLNQFLKPHGRFFAPHVSTTSRATIGGMVSNDSSGKGSIVYGRTSDHIESIEFILPDGAVVELGRVARRELAGLTGTQGAIARKIDGILAPHAVEIRERLPRMRRGFTGYNLGEARSREGDLNLAKLVAGSEGTLGLIKSVTLRSLRIPAHTVLVVLVYRGNEAGLRAVPHLLQDRPHAIEFIDDKILTAALRSPFANDVRNVLGIEADTASQAAHFLEMSDDDAARLDERLRNFLQRLAVLEDPSLRPIGFRVVRGLAEIARVWDMRASCQGLLAGFERDKRAVAFIEDCAVPPENLADFVTDLEKVLGDKGISLGMYGHADVGCVHIRPLMNLSFEDQRRQIRLISDAVLDLTQKYGGLLWGEHGKGLRGEYSERVIGTKLFGVMQQIKGVFDPRNQMNPGKIAHPADDDTPLLALDRVPMRGAFDEQISPDLSATFASVLRCDGNGSCFNQDESDPFCPSYKATGDRRFSPKTRSGLLREWARARSLGNDAWATAVADELNMVLDTCLACKACAGPGCPARVDIPQMKSQFLDWHHRKHRRPLADYIVANLERMAPLMDRLGAGLVNRVQAAWLTRRIMSRAFGLVDLPDLRNRRKFLRGLRAQGTKTLSAGQILRMPDNDRREIVVIVQDCFTSYFDADVVLAQVELVRKLGRAPILLSYREGGKPLHVKGFLARFQRVADRNARDLAALHQAGFTLVGVDSATTLMYRYEYPGSLHDCPDFKVLLLGEWLATVDLPRYESGKTYALVQHCTERSLLPETAAQWGANFERAGLNAHIVKTGCCGMSGLFGHEASHQEISTTLYDQNWRALVETQSSEQVVATGYSCRSQAKRLSGIRIMHPAQALLNHYAANDARYPPSRALRRDAVIRPGVCAPSKETFDTHRSL